MQLTLLDEKGHSPEGKLEPLRREESEASDDDEREILCASCRHVVSQAKWRFAKDGKQDHVFTNPHGFTFHIVCFLEAPGAAATGPSSNEWSWFAGYEWRAAACRGCLTHLGWVFQDDSNSFWGLIVGRLDGL